MGKMIFVAGYVAGGKSTFSRRLSEELGIPVFNKDTIKSVLGDHITIHTREDSLTLSRATLGLMAHIADHLMATNIPLILESNFNTGDAVVFNKLIEQRGYAPLTFMLIGDLRVMYERFYAREQNGTREPANRAFGTVDFESFARGVSALADFDVGGQIIRIDTTAFDRVDWQQYIDMARMFIGA